jgi:stage III sporulation protein AG
MEKIRDFWKTLVEKTGREKLLLIAVAAGVLIVCSIPEKSGSETEETTTSNAVENTTADTMDAYVKTLEQRLEDLIGQIEGVGEVSVMITLEGSESKEILKDENVQKDNTTETDQNGGERMIESYEKSENTIYSKDASGTETPYVLSEIAPQVKGVAVVAEGAQNAAIKEKIIQLIKALFGIEINKIMVTV